MIFVVETTKGAAFQSNCSRFNNANFKFSQKTQGRFTRWLCILGSIFQQKKTQIPCCLKLSREKWK